MEPLPALNSCSFNPSMIFRKSMLTTEPTEEKNDLNKPDEGQRLSEHGQRWTTCFCMKCHDPLSSSIPWRRLANAPPFLQGMSTSFLLHNYPLPFPKMQMAFSFKMPEGIKWRAILDPSTTMVWPALAPPWQRATTSFVFKIVNVEEKERKKKKKKEREKEIKVRIE